MISVRVNELQPNVAAQNAVVDQAEIVGYEPRANRKNHFGPAKPHVVIHLRSGNTIITYDTMAELQAKLAAVGVGIEI